MFNKIKKVLSQDISILTKPDEIKALFSSDMSLWNSDLFEAVKSQNLKELDSLLKLGYAANALSEMGDSYLHYAVKFNLLFSLKLLIPYCENIDFLNKEGFSALHYACQIPQLECAQALIEASASPNFKTIRGSTALHLAVVHDNPRLLRLLHEAKANWYEIDSNGKNCLELLEFYRPHAVNSWKRRAEEKSP